MFQQWQRIILAALMITVPLAAGAATDHDQHAAAAKTKKSAKPGKAARGSAKPGSGSHSPAAMSHRPPTPPPPPSHSHFDIPQAKNLAETPDVVLNTRVRAALMAALSARNAEEITPQTTKGVVTLTGSVKSKELRTRAEQSARKVHGVRAVKNQLAVK
jgi:hyperosmotically inducible periplasmic protein